MESRLGKNQNKKMKKHTPLSTLLVLALTLLNVPMSHAKKSEMIPTPIAEKPTADDEKASLPSFSAIQESYAQKTQIALNGLSGVLKTEDLRDAKNLSIALRALENNQAFLALSALKTISTKSTLAPYAQYYRAKALSDLNKYPEALTELPVLTNPKNKIEWEMFWLRLNILGLLKQKETVHTVAAAIQRLHGKDRWVVIKSTFYRGQAEWHVGNKTVAKKYFESILVQDAGTEYDDKIFSLFKSAKLTDSQILSEAQWNLRAEKLITNGTPQKARLIWQRFASQNASYRERLAYGYFRERNYRQAAKLYTELLKTGGATSPEVDILTKMAQSYARHDNFDGAINTNALIIKKFPKTAAASQAATKLGFLYFDSGQYQKAITYFDKYRPSGTQRELANWYRLWSFYLLGKYDQALSEMRAWGKIKTADKKTRLMAQYWEARILTKLGQGNAAKALYTQLTQMDRVGYYGFLAAQRLKSGKLVPPLLVDTSVLQGVPRGHDKVDLAKSALGLVPERDSLIRAVLLAQMGLDSFAYSESTNSTLLKNAGENIQEVFHLASNYHSGHTLAYAALKSGSAPLSSYRLGFPQAYAKYVKKFAAQWQINENLAYAIMRQESAFKPEAKSFAFAYGLMQIIPPTGDEIANQVGFKGFHAALLNQPLINTYFGTFYLSHLLKKFNGDIVYATAAYNAGPEAVKRWSTKSTSLEKDEFIELIPYKETREYVKRVLVNHLIYDRIYP